MATMNWDALERIIKSEIEPLLKQFGFTSKGSEITENGGFYIEYEAMDQKLLPISIHGIKQIKLPYVGRMEHEIWLRVSLGPTYLKTWIGTDAEANSPLNGGWTYTSDLEMQNSIQEIVDGLKQYLTSPSEK